MGKKSARPRVLKTKLAVQSSGRSIDSVQRILEIGANPQHALTSIQSTESIDFSSRISENKEENVTELVSSVCSSQDGVDARARKRKENGRYLLFKRREEKENEFSLMELIVNKIEMIVRGNLLSDPALPMHHPTNKARQIAVSDQSLRTPSTTLVAH